MSPSTSYSLYPCCISFLASLPLSPQCSHSIAGWAVHWRVAAPFQSVTGQICSRWDLPWVQLGFRPTRPTHSNQLRRTNRWMIECIVYQWVPGQGGVTGQGGGPIRLSSHTLPPSEQLWCYPKWGLVGKWRLLVMWTFSSPEGSTQMNLPSTKLWSIRWFVTSHAITFQTLAVRTLNGTASERASNG